MLQSSCLFVLIDLHSIYFAKTRHGGDTLSLPHHLAVHRDGSTCPTPSRASVTSITYQGYFYSNRGSCAERPAGHCRKCCEMIGTESNMYVPTMRFATGDVNYQILALCFVGGRGKVGGNFRRSSIWKWRSGRKEGGKKECVGDSWLAVSGVRSASQSGERDN